MTTEIAHPESGLKANNGVDRAFDTFIRKDSYEPAFLCEPPPSYVTMAELQTNPHTSLRSEPRQHMTSIHDYGNQTNKSAHAVFSDNMGLGAKSGNLGESISTEDCKSQQLIDPLDNTEPLDSLRIADTDLFDSLLNDENEDSLFIPILAETQEQLPVNHQANTTFQPHEICFEDLKDEEKKQTELLPDDEDDREAMERLKVAKAIFEEMEAKGTLTLADRVDLMRMEQEVSARLRKRQADLQWDTESCANRDQSLDPSLSAATFGALSPSRSGVTPSEDTREAKPSRKRHKPTMVEDDEMEQPKPRKRGKRAVPTKESQSTKKATTQAKEAQKEKPIRDSAQNMVNFRSLYGTNVFRETLATAELRNQPKFASTTRRDAALAQLIASVPPEDRKGARAEQRDLLAALRDFNGKGSVKTGTGPNEGTWVVTGMRTGLRNYQVLGAAFLRRRESGTDEPLGGILADDMGLGKTLMMCANIVNGKAPKDGPRATLIVATPALCSQWDAEIRKHCYRSNEAKHGLGMILQHRTPGARFHQQEQLESANIVLTTYHEVMRSFPLCDPPDELTTPAQKDQWWLKHYEEHRGLLHKTTFFRVVLDEAQAIKNHSSRVSMACCALQAKHRWAVTGTPVSNGVSEFYAFLRFLRHPNAGTFRTFKKNFQDNAEGHTRLCLMLRPILVRRTHAETFMNARILDLPDCHDNLIELDFNMVERQIYDIVKSRYIKRINNVSKRNEPEKGYNMIWTLLLRLRQLTSHILLVQQTLIDLLEREDLEKLNRLCDADHEMSGDEDGALLMQLRNTMDRAIKQKVAQGWIDGDLTKEDLVNVQAQNQAVDEGLGGYFGKSFRFAKYLNSIMASKNFEKIKDRQACGGCHQTPTEPHITSCHHIYCLACLQNLHHLAARMGRDKAICNVCGEHFISSKPCNELNTVPSDADVAPAEETVTSKGTKVDGRKKKSKKNKLNMEDWIDMKGEICTSAKTRAVKAQIMNWLAHDKLEQEAKQKNAMQEGLTIDNTPSYNKKIIVFSQFLPVIKILERVCVSEGWQYCRYTGAMSQTAREAQLVEFKTKPSKRILLASLKAGGVGLNLTEASRCINMDPWWNFAVENQAFARVFRIGQTEETYMTRLVVRNTIDSAMQAMKLRKEAEINEVIENPRKNDKFSVEELMRLFGPVGKDEHGCPFIFTEEAMDDEKANAASHLKRPARHKDARDQDFLGNDA